MPCALHWDLGDIVAMLGSSFLSILVPVFSKPFELRIRILRTHLCLQVANGTTHFSGCLLLVFKVTFGTFGFDPPGPVCAAALQRRFHIVGDPSHAVMRQQTFFSLAGLNVSDLSLSWLSPVRPVPSLLPSCPRSSRQPNSEEASQTGHIDLRYEVLISQFIPFFASDSSHPALIDTWGTS